MSPPISVTSTPVVQPPGALPKINQPIKKENVIKAELDNSSSSSLNVSNPSPLTSGGKEYLKIFMNYVDNHATFSFIDEI